MVENSIPENSDTPPFARKEMGGCKVDPCTSIIAANNASPSSPLELQDHWPWWSRKMTSSRSSSNSFSNPWASWNWHRTCISPEKQERIQVIHPKLHHQRNCQNSLPWVHSLQLTFSLCPAMLGRPTSKHHNSRLHLFSLAVTYAASGKCGVSSSVQDCSLRTVHFEGCKTQECQFCSSLNLGLNLQRPSISWNRKILQ